MMMMTTKMIYDDYDDDYDDDDEGPFSEVQAQ